MLGTAPISLPEQGNEVKEENRQEFEREKNEGGGTGVSERRRDLVAGGSSWANRHVASVCIQ